MHPDDRRAMLVSLTRQGQLLCDDLNEVNDKLSRKIFATIPAERRQDVLCDFELLVEAINANR